MKNTAREFCAVSVLLGVVACFGGPPSAAAPKPALTYYRDVKPIVDDKCATCHVAGGIASFPLTSVDDVVTQAGPIRAATSARRMPPWLAAPGCQAYTGDISLSDDQIQTISDWVDQGAQAGDPSDMGAPIATSNGGLSRVDTTIQMPASYTPVIHPDEYRCFLVDWPEKATKYVTGFQVRPGDTRIVHHVIAFLVAPDQVASFESMNGGGNGWSCFGGPGGSGNASWLGAWVPGNQGADFYEGTGIKVQAGSKIVLQVHYNTLYTPTGTDRSSLDFKLADSVDKEAAIVPYANPQWVQGGMSIAAGNPDVAYSWSYDVSPFVSLVTGGAIPNGPFLVYGAGLHMHLLGTSIKTSITRADGSGDTCLVDIPSWNFHWQRLYQTVAPVEFHPGDKLNLECHWNNSQANQPIVDGQQAPAQTVNWGEGTTDEMCLGVMYITAP